MARDGPPTPSDTPDPGHAATTPEHHPTEGHTQMATSPKPPPEDGDGYIRPFLDWLREHNGGQTADEMSEGIHILTGRVQDTGKAGTIQLTFRIEPMKGGNGNIVVVSDQIKLKLPEFERTSSVFYVDEHGNQTRQDPNQLTFDTLREVPGVGEVDKATGEIKEQKA